MAEVQMHTPQDEVDLQINMTDVDSGGILIEMGSEVEVVATPKRGRGRPRGKVHTSKSTEDVSRPKRSSRKRTAKSTSDHGSKSKKKYTKRSKKDDRNLDNEKLGKEEKGRRARRKKESNDKKSRPPRDKNNHQKSNQNVQLPTIDLQDDKKYASSGEDSVVFMDDIPPLVTIPSTPDRSPYNSSSYEPDKPRRLEDSTSDGSSSSSSGSDSDSDYTASSIGSRLTDESDRSVEHVPTPPPGNNGYDHRNPSPLGWSQYHSSGSEDDEVAKINNGSGPPPGTPPRSPSSASSESADKSFQCHSCRKWFSSTVTLRIHKRSHVTKPGGSTSSGGRSSRRYECDCCDATFTRRERLEQHRTETHRGSLTVQCEVCGRGFEDEEQQRKHAATHTADERAGRCTACGEVTGGWEQLRKHRATHAAPANHACPLCRKVFTYVQSLSRHLMNHSKAVYKCVVCKTSFDDANALASHLNSHLDRYKQLKT